MRFIRICLCLSATTLSQLQAGASPQKLVERARHSRAADAEADVRKALQLWERSNSTDTGDYAAALVFLGLILCGRESGDPYHMAADVGPLAERAANICDRVTCAAETLPLALDLQAEVLSAHSDAARAKAASDRAFQLRGLSGGPAPPWKAAAPDAKRAGGSVTAPKIVRRREPEYSEAARWAKRNGTVMLKLLVDSDGAPQLVRVVRAIGFGLDEKAVEAVSQWRFIPGTENGTPVKVMANVEVTFRLL
jgi:TonB family protein